jgi:hypothetical protein
MRAMEMGTMQMGVTRATMVWIGWACPRRVERLLYGFRERWRYRRAVLGRATALPLFTRSLALLFGALGPSVRCAISWQGE